MSIPNTRFVRDLASASSRGLVAGLTIAVLATAGLCYAANELLLIPRFARKYLTGPRDEDIACFVGALKGKFPEGEDGPVFSAPGYRHSDLAVECPVTYAPELGDVPTSPRFTILIRHLDGGRRLVVEWLTDVKGARFLLPDDGQLVSLRTSMLGITTLQSESPGYRTISPQRIIARAIKLREDWGKRFDCDPDQQELEKLRISLEAFFRESYDPMARDLVVLRVFNGPIQWATVLCFVLLVMSVLARYSVFVVAERATRGGLRGLSRLSESTLAACQDRLEKLRGRIRFSSVYYEMYWSALVSFREDKNLNAVPAMLEAQSQTALERIGSGYSLIRFLAWAMPSIGFIGTVLGIGQALLGTKDILSEQTDQQQGAIEAVAAELGVAFDTTLVALVLSIVAMFLIHIIQQREEEIVLHAKDSALKLVVEPESADLGQRPIRYARKLLPELKKQAVFALASFVSVLFFIGMVFPHSWVSSLLEGWIR